MLRALPMLLVLLLPIIAACGTTAPTTPQASSSAEPSTATSAAPSVASSTAANAAPSEAAASSAASSQPIGEQLDLANLSPDIPGPSAPVTIKFASWVGEQEGMQKLADQFHKLHPRACYVLSTMNVMKRLTINMAKARKCKPANVSGNRS